MGWGGGVFQREEEKVSMGYIRKEKQEKQQEEFCSSAAGSEGRWATSSS